MPGRLSAYVFILAGAVLLAVASAFAGAQSQRAPAETARAAPAAPSRLAARDQPVLRVEGKRQEDPSRDRNRRTQ